VDEHARRVSDVERERTVVALREDLLAGRLTLEEFSERVERAYAATVGTELELARESLPAATAPTRRRATRMSIVALGHLVRRGRLRLRRWTFAVSVLGDLDLDLRDAQLETSKVTVRLGVLFGNADVYVPEGIDVDVGGTILFGRRRDWGPDRARETTPLLRVRAYGLLGTVDVWRVPAEVRGTYGEVIDAIRSRQHALPPGDPGGS
jgi:hypothetical protein